MSDSGFPGQDLSWSHAPLRTEQGFCKLQGARASGPSGFRVCSLVLRREWGNGL